MSFTLKLVRKFIAYSQTKFTLQEKWQARVIYRRRDVPTIYLFHHDSAMP